MQLAQGLQPIWPALVTQQFWRQPFGQLPRADTLRPPPRFQQLNRLRHQFLPPPLRQAGGGRIDRLKARRPGGLFRQQQAGWVPNLGHIEHAKAQFATYHSRRTYRILFLQHGRAALVKKYQLRHATAIAHPNQIGAVVPPFRAMGKAVAPRARRRPMFDDLYG